MIENDPTVTVLHPIGPMFETEFKTAGLSGEHFSWSPDGVYYSTEMPADKVTILLSVIDKHDSTKAAPPVVPDNPTLGDWRVGLALWATTDANGQPTTWLTQLNITVKSMLASGSPVGQVAAQRMEYSNNVKRLELMQLKDAFGFTAEQVDESLWRAYQVSLGDLSGKWPLSD